MAERHVIINCINWNRERLDFAQRSRNSEKKEVAIEACRHAQRFANNITRLEAQL